MSKAEYGDDRKPVKAPGIPCRAGLDGSCHCILQASVIIEPRPLLSVAERIDGEVIDLCPLSLTLMS